MSHKNAVVNDVSGKVGLFIAHLAKTFDKRTAKRKRFWIPDIMEGYDTCYHEFKVILSASWETLQGRQLSTASTINPCQIRQPSMADHC